MDIDSQFARMNGDLRDIVYCKNHLLQNKVLTVKEENDVKDNYQKCLNGDVVTYTSSFVIFSGLFFSSHPETIIFQSYFIHKGSKSKEVLKKVYNCFMM